MQGHGIEIHDEPRRIVVSVDGTELAASARTRVLQETGLPPRYYFPRDDVHFELLDATPTETVCPFKGQASYWSVRTPAGEHRDLAWCYETPIEAAAAIGGYVCFYSERSDLTIDGETQTRPETPWSKATTG
jgi:uncharacterized protein (DUF427 family)